MLIGPGCHAMTVKSAKESSLAADEVKRTRLISIERK